MIIRETLMKKILISLALSLGSLATSAVMAATPSFSTQQMAQTKLHDLSFKQVMRAFYTGQMNEVYVDNKNINTMPHIGLGDEKDGEQPVAVMHPIIDYYSASGEPRYLVMIEKVLVDSDEGDLIFCHPCGATADLYSFKQLNDGRYQLVSQSTPDMELSGSWGRIDVDSASLKRGIEPLGINIVGSIFKTSYSSLNQDSSTWYALHLPENDYINVYHLSDAGGNNGGEYHEHSPLYYEYNVEYSVLADTSSKYYPIMLSFKGDKPTDDFERIETVNTRKLKKFDSVNKEYY
ncbi:hypothetical protein [Psychrobacter sanguinis]|nr:hypothetical protein [Psychrobacter sanguinis]